MKKVSSTFAGDVLCKKLICEISAIKKQKNNAAENIALAVKISEQIQMVELSTRPLTRLSTKCKL